MIWDIIADIEIHCITDIDIIINTCASIVEGILINSTGAVVEITSCWEILIHHISHIIACVIDNIAWNIHPIDWHIRSIIHSVEIHLIWIEVILDILGILHILVSLFLIGVIIVPSLIVAIVVIYSLSRDHLQILSLQDQILCFVTLTLLDLLHDIHSSLSYFRLDCW